MNSASSIVLYVRVFRDLDSADALTRLLHTCWASVGSVQATLSPDADMIHDAVKGVTLLARSMCLLGFGQQEDGCDQRLSCRRQVRVGTECPNPSFCAYLDMVA